MHAALGTHIPAVDRQRAPVVQPVWRDTVSTLCVQDSRPAGSDLRWVKVWPPEAGRVPTLPRDTAVVKVRQGPSLLWLHVPHAAAVYGVSQLGLCRVRGRPVRAQGLHALCTQARRQEGSHSGARVAQTQSECVTIQTNVCVPTNERHVCERQVDRSTTMSVALVTKAVEDTKVFNESYLSRIVAEYTGGLCTTGKPEHGVRTVRLKPLWHDPARAIEATRKCSTCPRVTCDECSWSGGYELCSNCFRSYCMDCYESQTVPCLEQPDCRICPRCAKKPNVTLVCCADGLRRALCSECRHDGNYAAENVCHGCETVLCPTCQERKCRCGATWCERCFADRRDAVCRHGPACKMCWDHLYEHSCKPRRKKRRRVAPGCLEVYQKMRRILAAKRSKTTPSDYVRVVRDREQWPLV